MFPLAVPLLSLNLGQKDVAALSTSTTERRAYDLISQNFGPGANGPPLVAVSLGSPAQASTASASGSSSGSAGSDPRATDPRLQTLQKDVSTTPGVKAVTQVQIDKAGTTAYFDAIATTGPADQATAALVSKLRSSVIPAAEKGTNMTAYIGGITASYLDLASVIASKLLLQILVVIARSFVLLLLLAFRTVVIPVQAAVMNLLSIGAVYGVLAAIFQWGWLHGLIGLDGAVPIVSYVPLFMFAVLFGQSMDYEVFLVSQIKEHVDAGHDNKSSVVSGLVTSAVVITAAASIMVFVFGGFVLNGDPTVKQRLLFPEYQLAPEHPFPAAIDDALAARRWLRAGQDLSAPSLAVAGDSAGRGLATALLVAARDAGQAVPAAAALLSPTVDLTSSGASMTERADQDPVSTPAMLGQFAAGYLAGADPKTPPWRRRCSPRWPGSRRC